MEAIITLLEIFFKICLLAAMSFASALLVAVFWVVYVYRKEDEDGNQD